MTASVEANGAQRPVAPWTPAGTNDIERPTAHISGVGLG